MQESARHPLAGASAGQLSRPLRLGLLEHSWLTVNSLNTRRNVSTWSRNRDMCLLMFQKLTAWRINHAIDQGNGAKAEIAARSYAEKRPKDPMAWVMWGHGLARHSALEKAITGLRQGLARQPTCLAVAA